MADKENRIQAAILTYLKEQGIFCWRNNNGAVYDAKLGQYRAHNGLKGVGDIIGMLPDGRFLSVEVKTKTGVVSADQQFFIKRCERSGGLCFVARSIEDVKERLNSAL